MSRQALDADRVQNYNNAFYTLQYVAGGGLAILAS
jgi:hypothetical protein